METKDMIIIGAIALLVFGFVFQASQINSLKNKITGNVVNSNGQLDTTGWTENEKMNYEHHGTIPARLQGKNVQSQPSSSGMVGGC